MENKETLQSIYEYLNSNFLFKNSNFEECFEFIKNSYIYAKYKKNQTIYSPSQSKIQKNLIIIKKGCARVYSQDVERNILLTTLNENQVFGVCSLFSNEDFVSRVIAEQNTEVIIIPENCMRFLLETNKNIMYNYIAFLSNRICYLNQKILCLTAGSAERKLAFFLDSLGNSDIVELPFSINAMSDMLDLGRASLYRAIDKLVQDGFIIKDGKNFTLLNRQKMLEYY